MSFSILLIGLLGFILTAEVFASPSISHSERESGGLSMAVADDFNSFCAPLNNPDFQPARQLPGPEDCSMAPCHFGHCSSELSDFAFSFLNSELVLSKIDFKDSVLKSPILEGPLRPPIFC